MSWTLPLLVAACGTSSAIDPNEGALHLGELGQVDQYGRSDAPVPRAGAVARRPGASGGRHEVHIDNLRAVIDQRWAHRSVHEDVDGLDVDAVFDRLRTEATGVGGGDYATAIDRALCRLGDGNLRPVVEGRARSSSGLRVRAVGQALVLAGTDDSRYERTAAGGDLVLAIDGVPTSEWIRGRCEYPGSTPGQRMARLAQTLESSVGKRRNARPKRLVMRRARTGKSYELALQWNRADETPSCVEGRQLASKVGVVRVHSLACEGDGGRFDRELETAIQTAGGEHVLLDLRRTDGGDEALAKRVARRFAPSAQVWTSVRAGGSGHKKGSGAFVDEPLEVDGPAVTARRRWLLVGPRCDNACEMLAAVVAADPEVTTVGATTAGAVARPESTTVGGTQVWLPTVQFALPGTQTPIEARGVAVDIAVTPTIDELARDHDPEVVAIARRIGGQD